MMLQEGRSLELSLKLLNGAIDIPISKKTILNASLGIENLFNTSYREYLNRLRYFADDIGRNITLQIKINY